MSKLPQYVDYVHYLIAAFAVFIAIVIYLYTSNI